MGCIITPPTEHNTNTETQTNEPHNIQFTIGTVYKTDYERILSSPGLLEVPKRFQKWFPQRHGHIHIAQLFKYHRKLGNSANASVHEIDYKSEICAVKQIEKNNEYGRMLFETETQVLSMLKHNNIIQLKDVLFDENYYYLVVQKADFDLHQLLIQQRNLTEIKTRKIVYSLLKALCYMHRKNLVHRDLKPENIMFMSTDTNHPLLIDFGDAELTQNDKIYTEFVGTPSYMSPERLGEHKGWELKKSDIWAIGAIAYEMYCGRQCFVENTQKHIFGCILRGEWSWPQDRVPSDDFKAFVEQCLAHDAKDRPSAIKALDYPWFAVIRVEEEFNAEMNVKQTNA